MSENKKESKLFKPISSNAKSSRRLKKLFGFILVAYIILFVCLYAKNKYGTISNDAMTRIGAGNETNITINKTLRIKERSIDRYKGYLESENYELAYNMLTDEYKAYCDYDTYLEKISDIDISTIEVEDINAKNDYCYIAYVVYYQNGKKIEQKYLMYVNDYDTDTFYLSPDGFIDSIQNQDFEKDGVTLHIDECTTYIDRVDLKCNIKNTSWFSDFNISSVNVAYGTALVANKPVELAIKKGEDIDFSNTYTGFEFFIPNSLQIEIDEGNDEVKLFSFYFKEKNK